MDPRLMKNRSSADMGTSDKFKLTEEERRNEYFGGGATSTAGDEDYVFVKQSGSNIQSQQHSTSRLPTFGSPIPLTKAPMPLMTMNEKSRKLELNEEALTWLSQQEKQIAVASIVGPTGLGKSFLLNEIMGQQEGFTYENNIDGTTRGIWIWGMEHPWKKNQILLLLDTEGQQDVQRDDAYDVEIALMTMLLSSVMIFNITKKIGSDLIKQLGALVGHAKQIHINDKTSDDLQDINKYLPTLVVLVRDFQCNLNFKGSEVTPDRYLEACLHDKVSESDTWLDRGKVFTGLKKNKEKHSHNMSQVILEMFPANKRYCQILPCPFFDYKKVKLPPGVPEFEVGVTELKQLIARIAKPKVFVKSDAVNGRLFAVLVRKYVDVLNNGDVVCIQPTYTLIAKEENNRLMTEGIAMYKDRMKKLHYPLDSKEFTDQHTKISQEIAAKLIHKVIFDNAANFRETLQTKLVEVHNDMVVLNENSSYKKCEEILKKLHRTISEKLEAKIYYCPGGYDVYKEDMEMLKREYETIDKKGVKSDEVLLKFLSEKETERTLIITADSQMTSMKIKEEATQRLEEERKIRDEQIKKEQEENKERIESLMRQMEEVKESFDREREEREKMFEEQLESQRKQIQNYEERVRELEQPKCIIL